MTSSRTNNVPAVAGRGRKMPSASGFTLLELLLALGLMAVVCTVTFLTFSVVSTSWQTGMALSDELNHADYVIDQLAMALRSSYHPGGGPNPKYGFLFDDGGSGEYGSDEISWVKLGGSLVGQHCPFAGSPHRVTFYVGPDKDGESCAMIKAWQIQGLPDDFDPDRLDPVVLSRNVTGFDCRIASKINEDEIEWDSTWEKTNEVPNMVEITLYMKPVQEHGDPVEVKRVVIIPTAPLSHPQ